MRNGIQQHRALRFQGVFVLLTLALAVTLAIPAAAQPVPGSLESFPGASLGGWASSDLITNPGADGVLGPGDGLGGNFWQCDTGFIPPQTRRPPPRLGVVAVD